MARDKATNPDAPVQVNAFLDERKPARSFWTEKPQYSYSGERFLTEDQKQALAMRATPFRIAAATFNPTNQYNGQNAPRWELLITWPLADDDVRYDTDGVLVTESRAILTLASNEQRDMMLNDMRAYITESGDSVECMLRWIAPKEGNAFYALAAPSEVIDV